MNASGVAVSAPTKPEIVMSGKEASDQALFTGTASIDMAVPEGASATHRHAARVASPGARGDDLPGPPVRRLCVLLTVARPIGPFCQERTGRRPGATPAAARPTG